MVDWITLQLADSSFPTGGFAHSGGLEAAHQAGALEGPGALAHFLDDALWSAGHLTLPFVAAAWDAPAAFLELDAAHDAALRSPVANAASRSQGRAHLEACVRAFGDLHAPVPEVNVVVPEVHRQASDPHGAVPEVHHQASDPHRAGQTPFCALRVLRASARAAGSPRHLAPVLGATLGILGVARDDALRLHLHGVARGVVSAAVRLGICGPGEAQRLQASAAATQGAVLAACSALEPGAQTQTAPLIDLLGAGHDRLYSRLFTS